MKIYPLLFTILIILSACVNHQKSDAENPANTEVSYLVFGDSLVADGAISKEEMAMIYEGLTANDTVSVKFTSTVNAVCQRKGCWMRLDLGEGKEAQIKFKDYGFFVPKNIASEEVIVEGKAYITVLTEHERKYYATDEGKSEDEIAAITGDTKTLLFEAHGVLLKE